MRYFFLIVIAVLFLALGALEVVSARSGSLAALTSDPVAAAAWRGR